MTNEKFVTIEIVDEATLFQAFDILHDATFDLDQAKYGEQSGVWRAVFIREFFEDPSLLIERRNFLFSRFSYPMVECLVELTGVRKLEVRDDAKIGAYDFIECHTQSGQYRLTFCADMEITFAFEQSPRGRLHDLKFTGDRKTMITPLPFLFRKRPAS